MNSNQIEIPEDLINRFKSYEDEAAQPGAEGFGERQEAGSEELLNGFVDFLKWGIKTADDQARQLGYTGTGKVPPDQLAEVWGMVAKRNASSKFLEKTPEFIAISVTASILGVNLIDHRKKKLSSAEKKPEKESND